MVPPLFAVLVWPLVALVFFARFRMHVAIVVTLIAGYLLLPGQTALNLPVLPSITKHTIPSFAVLLWVLLFYQSTRMDKTQPALFLEGWLPKDRFMRWLFFGAVGGIVMTVFTNGDRLVFPNLTLPGLRTYDIFSGGLTFLVTLLPLFLARKYLASPASHRVLLSALAIAGFAYSFLALYEIRLSPQINNIVYGFYPSGWIQNLRDGGFRPFVFLGHGLKLGIFLSCAVLAALALALRGTPRWRPHFWFIFLWLFATLALTKAFGAFLIAVILIPVLIVFSCRIQITCAALLAGAVLLYPMLRSVDLVPTERIVSVVRGIDDERSRSLQYRINNENILLEKANQRPIFGWGGWARARVYNENGRDISTTDGYWVITMGEGGWIGYIGAFGLLCGPVILLAWRRDTIDLDAAALSIVLTANLLDLIPNSGISPVTWLIAGALMGRLDYKVASSETPTETAGADKPRYSRRPIQPGTRHRPSVTSSRAPAPKTNRSDRSHDV